MARHLALLIRGKNELLMYIHIKVFVFLFSLSSGVPKNWPFGIVLSQPTSYQIWHTNSKMSTKTGGIQKKKIAL